MIEDPDPYLWQVDPEVQKHVDPVDPDPDSDPDLEHCCAVYIIYLCILTPTQVAQAW